MNTETQLVGKIRAIVGVPNARQRIFIGLSILLALEIALRSIFGLGHPLLFVPDPACGSMPAPNQDLHRFFAHIQINEFGMRSGNFPRVKPLGEKRLLFVGDSVTFGTTYVDQKLIFTDLLNEYYAKNSPTPVVVMNASTPGWAPANELGFIRSKGVFAADLVAFVVNTKDLIQPFARFMIGPTTPTRDPYSAIGESLDRYVLPRILGYRNPVDPGSEMSGDPQAELGKTDILEVLAAAKHIVDGKGARFIIIYSPMVDADIISYQSRWDQGVEMLMAWSARENVGMIDMRKSYSRYAQSQIYFDGMHLRPLGHQVMSDEFVKMYK